MDPLTLRDSLSVTGVPCPAMAMTVGPLGQIIFRRSVQELIYYDVQEHSECLVSLAKLDPLYDDCQIFDISFVREGGVVVCLQRVSSMEFFICEASLDTQERILDVSGPVYRTKIFATKGKTVAVLHDEAGLVLVSYPIRWTANNDTVELFHISHFLKTHLGDKYIVSLVTKDNVSATFSSPFISRNHLYLFYADNFSKFLLVPITGANCGKCEVRTTHGNPPNSGFMSKVAIVFEEFVLFYAHLNVRKINPNFYMLNLTNLRWFPMNLTLSHHFPNGRISFQKMSEELVYLHGDCNIPSCPEKSHLYQISTEEIHNLIVPRQRSQSAHSLTENFTSLSNNNPSLSSSQASDTPPPTPICEVPHYSKSDTPVFRYIKKQNSDLTRRRSTASLRNSKGASSGSFAEEPIKRIPSTSSLHWSADMAEQCSASLKDQLKLAMDWGFPDDVVMAALRLNQKDDHEMYSPFESTNKMLDILHQINGKIDVHKNKNNNNKDQKFKLSLYNSDHEKAISRNGRERSSSISRSQSFSNGVAPRGSRTENHDILRLVQTLDREKERDKAEVEQQFSILKQRIHCLESEREGSRMENERLRSDILRITTNFDEISKKNREDSQQIETFKAEIDRLTIEALHAKRDLDQQRELAEHRKRKHDEESAKKDEQLSLWQEKCAQLMIELERKAALLDEQTEISRRMEQKTRAMVTSELLEELLSESQKATEHLSQSRNSQHRIEELYRQLREQMTRLEEDNKKLATDLLMERQLREEERDEHFRRMRSLSEKTTSECCICLTMKPSVVFLPCKHLVICESCSTAERTITSCPTCRTEIEDQLKVFY